MSSTENINTNAAYVASWKQINPKLTDLKMEGVYLYYQNEKLDIRNIYMQDLFSNPNLFHSIQFIDAYQLFQIIKIHVYAIKIKEYMLEQTQRRWQEYELQR